MSKRIGFDRHIKTEWLDTMAGLIQNERNIEIIRTSMHQYLERDLPNYVARRKTITVLLRIWFSVPEEHIEIRDRALEMLPKVRENDRIWIHWGMTLLAYPFFRDVAICMHHCFTLHDGCKRVEIVRKMEEMWGYRSTLGRATERVIQSFDYWNVIKRNKKTKKITRNIQFSSSRKEIEMLFLEMVLLSDPSHSLIMDQINSIPSAFPFIISLNYSDLTKSKKFLISQISGTRGMISLKSH